MKLLYIFLFSAVSLVSAQNLDSLYNRFVSLHTGSEKNNTPPVKCAFDINAGIAANFNNFTLQQQKTIKKINERPDTDESIVSPAGLFRVHYYGTEDSRHPTYDITEFAIALDSAYNYEVNILGYPAPVSDNGAGGDNLYDVYIINLGNLYGQTVFEDNFEGNKYSSYIEVQYNYNESFYTEGIDAARVTAAHEFHHAIQLSAYGFYSDNDYDETYFYEITSVAMEEFVYDGINDYYGYLNGFNSYFRNPGRTFRKTTGYDLGIWNIYLVEKLAKDYPANPSKGHGVIKKAWEYLSPGNRTAIQAYNLALNEAGTSIADEYHNFGVWTYFTKHRAKPGTYFEEGANYPAIRPVYDLSFTPPAMAQQLNTFPLSNTFLLYSENNGSGIDSLYILLSNSDAALAVTNPEKLTSATYTLYSSPQEGANKINDSYYDKLTVTTLGKEDMFTRSSMFNNELASGEGPSRNEKDFVYPQPFSYTKNLFMIIPVESDEAGEASLKVYSSSMDIVYEGTVTVGTIGSVGIKWNGLDNSGAALPTGVYIYAVEIGGETETGKLVIYNE